MTGFFSYTLKIRLYQGQGGGMRECAAQREEGVERKFFPETLALFSDLLFQQTGVISVKITQLLWDWTWYLNHATASWQEVLHHHLHMFLMLMFSHCHVFQQLSHSNIWDKQNEKFMTDIWKYSITVIYTDQVYPVSWFFRKDYKIDASINALINFLCAEYQNISVILIHIEKKENTWLRAKNNLMRYEHITLQINWLWWTFNQMNELPKVLCIFSRDQRHEKLVPWRFVLLNRRKGDM